MASKAYVIQHGGVAGWQQGAVVPASEFESRKFDVQRLLDLGAIREAAAEDVQQASQADAAAPANTTGSADVPAVPPAPVSDKGSK